MYRIMNRTLIVGGGAMGTLIASHLSEHVATVNVLTRWKAHRDAIEEFGGVRIEIGNETSTYRNVGFVEDVAEEKKYDTVFILTKSSGTEDAAHVARNMLSDDGLVVTLQNGIANEVLLCKMFGRHRVVAGVTSRGASVRTCGIIRDAGGGPTILRYPSYEDKKRTNEIAKVLNDSTFECKIASSDVDFATIAWTKLCANAVINPLTAISNVRNGDIDWVEWDNVALSVLRELREVADKHSKVRLPEESVLLDNVKTVARNTSTNRSSMLQDIDRKVRTEIDYINGFVVKESERFGLSAPTNQYLLEKINNLL